jgi:hypothetical protein
MALLTKTGWTARQNEAEAWGIAVLFSLPALWIGWRYRAAAIRTDSMGITQYSLFGKRFIAWGDIQDYYLSGEDTFTFGNLIGSQSRIRFWIQVAGRDKLLLEIIRRATHSRSSEWKKRERSSR